MRVIDLGVADVEGVVPADQLSVVFGEPSEISSRLIASPVIRKVSFTGSTKVGRQLAALSAVGIKKLTMELGGHPPPIIFEFAALDPLVAPSPRFKFLNPGQDYPA